MNKFLKTPLAVMLLIVSGASAAETMIHIENESGVRARGAFLSQSMVERDEEIAADSVNQFIPAHSSFNYLTTDDYLNAYAVDVKEGDVIPQVGVFNPSADKFVICGTDVEFSGVTHFKYDGDKCEEVGGDTTRIIILNKSDVSIYGAFNVGSGYASDSDAGWVDDGASHTWLPGNTWFASLGIAEGDHIDQVGVFDGKQYIDCEFNVEYSGVTTFEFDGETCQAK